MAGLLVVPSRRVEGLPLVVQEALLVGTPVLMSPSVDVGRKLVCRKGFSASLPTNRRNGHSL